MNLAVAGTYDYIQTTFQMLNEGLPRASYRVLGRLWREAKARDIKDSQCTHATMNLELSATSKPNGDDALSCVESFVAEDDLLHGDTSVAEKSLMMVADADHLYDRPSYEIYLNMLLVQYAGLLLMAVILLAVAAPFGNALAPPDPTRDTVNYVRLGVASNFFWSIEQTNGLMFRAMGWEKFPLYTAIIKTIVNMILDFVFLGALGDYGGNTVIVQGSTRATCSCVSAITSTLFLVKLIYDSLKRDRISSGEKWYRFFDIRIVWLWIKFGIWPLLESVIRNTFYLTLAYGIVGIGDVEASAWSGFNTIKWSTLMVTVMDCDMTTSALCGKRFGLWRHRIGAGDEAELPSVAVQNRNSMDHDKPVSNLGSVAVLDEVEVDEQRASRWKLWRKENYQRYKMRRRKRLEDDPDYMKSDSVFWVFYPALFFGFLTVLTQVIFILGFSFGGAETFVAWVFGGYVSDISLRITEMWNKIGWTFILLATDTAAKAVVLALSPPVVLVVSAVPNILYNLPWVVYLRGGALQSLSADAAWLDYSYVFGYL